MTQSLWALISFLLTGIALQLLVVLPGATVALRLLLGALTFLALVFATIILLVALAAVFALILESTPAGFLFWLASLLYLLATGALVYYALLPLYAAGWAGLLGALSGNSLLTSFANSILQAAAYLLLSTVIMFGPFFVLHFIAALVVYVFSASAQTGSDTPTADELNGRAFSIGMNAAVNLFVAGGVYFWLLHWLPGVSAFGPGVAWAVALVIVALIFVAAVRCLFWPTSGFTKGLAGWLMLLMPASIASEASGWLLFTLNLLGHVLFSWVPFAPAFGSFCTVLGVRLRGDTGSIVSTGGVVSNLSLVPTAYGVGRFVMVTFFLPLPVDTSVLLHEVGHHLNNAAFGSLWSSVNSADAALKRRTPGMGVWAYGERLAESNVLKPRRGRPRVDMWT